MGYTCDCPTGYSKEMNEGQIHCEDLDECQTSTSCVRAYEVCVNEPGTYECVCQAGFTREENSQECQDVDECSDGSHDCPEHELMQCVNSLGSFDCGKF